MFSQACVTSTRGRGWATPKVNHLPPPRGHVTTPPSLPPPGDQVTTPPFHLGPGHNTSLPPGTMHRWAVCILLECILVTRLCHSVHGRGCIPACNGAGRRVVCIPGCNGARGGGLYPRMHDTGMHPYFLTINPCCHGPRQHEVGVGEAAAHPDLYVAGPWAAGFYPER